MRGRPPKPAAHDIAAEIIRRAKGSYVVRLSRPPTLSEQLQLMAAQLERRPIVIMPHKCKTVDEWLEQYASQAAGGSAAR